MKYVIVKYENEDEVFEGKYGEWLEDVICKPEEVESYVKKWQKEYPNNMIIAEGEADLASCFPFYASEEFKHIVEKSDELNG
ncbi:MAG: hypothetical protein QXL94_04290 [Candidatus Parvarchaeum sp.]